MSGFIGVLVEGNTIFIKFAFNFQVIIELEFLFSCNYTIKFKVDQSHGILRIVYVLLHQLMTLIKKKNKTNCNTINKAMLDFKILI